MAETMAERAKAAREKAGLTQAQVAERMSGAGDDKSASWLRQVETGAVTGKPTRSLLLLARALGVDLTWLLDGDQTDGDAA
jgi:transcriptional regulator with XRE-family HTH domain